MTAPHPEDHLTPEKVTAVCPGCRAELTIDTRTGAVLWHQPETPAPQRSLSDMVKDLETKRQQVAERFERERRSLPERSRVLDEKVKESLKRVDPDAPPPIRPIDLD
jgi:hypothetical protein